ncbi:hypothetical protein JVT61DRAFT_4443 [Boletus reticuloceps]|uniref:Uncharacterized protein n=1 Tax=Boletus reticuloceps TaxID=495285 RepID=A0A8I3A924_9AGAM|nr:hypothetical protein JVT61DRAFT_4443 [Boletus reticuloceps]
MALLSTVLGFSVFGLASRFGQLGIQKRNLMDNLAGHAIAMVAFGYAGYWVHHYEVRTNELIAWKRAELQARADEREARI